MAYTAPTKLNSGSSLPSLLSRPFVAFGNLLIAIAEASPRAKLVAKLNATSDAELAARGVTRASEVDRIFGHRYYL